MPWQPKREEWHSSPKTISEGRNKIFIGWFFLKIGLALILVVLSLSEVLISAGTEMATMNNIDAMNSGFDVRGTITNVLSPSSIVIGNGCVNLEGVDPSGLYRSRIRI